MRIVAVVAIASCLVVGFVAGRSGSAPSRPAPVQPAPTRAAPTGYAPGPATREIRTVVRTEPGTAPAPIEPEPETAEDADRRDTALASAQDIVDRAIGSGRWTTDDAMAFRVAIAELRAEDFDTVMTALVAAANSGRIDVQTSGSLLAIH